MTERSRIIPSVTRRLGVTSVLVRDGHIQHLDPALPLRLVPDKVRQPLEGAGLDEADNLPLGFEHVLGLDLLDVAQDAFLDRARTLGALGRLLAVPVPVRRLRRLGRPGRLLEHAGRRR